MTPPVPAVELSGVRKRFGGTTALAGLDLRVPRGAFYLLVGPNGAGKTTALGILLGLLRPDAGAAVVSGRDSRRHGARVRAGVGYVDEGGALGYGWMRLKALLAHHAAYYPRWDPGYARELADMLEIDPGRRFGRLSRGQARRVQLLMALAHRPPLLVLDEPTDGLDPVGRSRFLELLATHLSRWPATVLLSTHRIHEARLLADHLGVIRRGRMRAQLSRAEWRRRIRLYAVRPPKDGGRRVAGAHEVLARGRNGAEELWTIRGEQREVLESLVGAGVSVLGVRTPTLEETALALLSGKEG